MVKPLLFGINKEISEPLQLKGLLVFAWPRQAAGSSHGAVPIVLALETQRPCRAGLPKDRAREPGDDFTHFS